MFFQTWRVLFSSLLVQFHCFVSHSQQCMVKGGEEEVEEGEEGVKWGRRRKYVVCLSWEWVCSVLEPDDQKKQKVTHNKLLFLALLHQLACTLALSLVTNVSTYFCIILYTSVHFCILLYTSVYFWILLDTFVYFCTLLYTSDTFVYFWILLYTSVYFCILLYIHCHFER